MSLALPDPPRFMHAIRPVTAPRHRVCDLKCVPCDASPLGWRWQTVYRPQQRPFWRVIRALWRWRVRAWRWEYGY